jgi:WD40 repeat protein
VTASTLDGQPIAISTSLDNTLRIWDLRTHQQLGAPLTGHNGTVYGVAASTLDGQPIAISSSGDRTLRIWDLAKRAGK